MAHTLKIKREACGQIGAHVDRSRPPGHRYGNENIDPSRTPLNYDLSGEGRPLSAIVAKAIEDAPGRRTRRDAVVLVSTVVTLPRDWPDGRDPREFFEAVREFDLYFWPETFREVRATVHMDETTPHMHHVALPLDADGRFAFARLYTRKQYREYHAALQRHVCERTGIRHLSILLDADDPDKALSALSQADYGRAKELTREAVAEASEAARLAEEAKGAKDVAEAEARDAEGRLERLRRDVAEAESLAEAGVVELARAAGDAPDPERKRVAEEENRRLRDRVSELENRHLELAEENRRLRDRAAGLERAVAEARSRVAGAVARVGALRERLRGLRERLLTRRFLPIGPRVAGSYAAVHESVEYERMAERPRGRNHGDLHVDFRQRKR